MKVRWPWEMYEAWQLLGKRLELLTGDADNVVILEPHGKQVA